MITHIVCWKYKADAAPVARGEHVSKLRALSPLVPGIISLSVGEDILHLDRSFDTGLIAHFEDREALDLYAGHPEHQAVVAFGRTISEQTVSVDFVSEG